MAFISGASINPARSLAPALLSGVLGNLWLYWSATFVGTSVVAFIIKGKIVSYLGYTYAARDNKTATTSTSAYSASGLK